MLILKHHKTPVRSVERTYRGLLFGIWYIGISYLMFGIWYLFFGILVAASIVISDLFRLVSGIGIFQVSAILFKNCPDLVMGKRRNKVQVAARHVGGREKRVDYGFLNSLGRSGEERVDLTVGKHGQLGTGMGEGVFVCRRESQEKVARAGMEASADAGDSKRRPSAYLGKLPGHERCIGGHDDND